MTFYYKPLNGWGSDVAISIGEDGEVGTNNGGTGRIGLGTGRIFTTDRRTK